MEDKMAVGALGRARNYGRDGPGRSVGLTLACLMYEGTECTSSSCNIHWKQVFLLIAEYMNLALHQFDVYPKRETIA